MEIANPKPRLGSAFVREAFIRHFLSHNVDDYLGSPKKRLLRAVMISKEFTAIMGDWLNGTSLWLEYCDAKNCWQCKFKEPFDEWLTEKESLIIFTFVKPTLGAVVLFSSNDGPPMNEQLTNCMAGIPKLSIYTSKVDPHSLALLNKMAPHLSSLYCLLKHLEFNLPPMKLERCEITYVSYWKVNFGPLFSKHQIRLILLDFYNNLNDNRIVCGGRSLNPSVEELVVKNAENSPVQLPQLLLTRLPNLKRVLLSWGTWCWDADYVDKLRASIECARYCVAKSPNLRVVFNVCVYFKNHSDTDVILGKLRDLKFIGDEEHSFVSKEELKDDPDIKSCSCYKKMNPRILVRSTGQIKFFFWGY